ASTESSDHNGYDRPNHQQGIISKRRVSVADHISPARDGQLHTEAQEGQRRLGRDGVPERQSDLSGAGDPYVRYDVKPNNSCRSGTHHVRRGDVLGASYPQGLCARQTRKSGHTYDGNCNDGAPHAWAEADSNDESKYECREG